MCNIAVLSLKGRCLWPVSILNFRHLGIFSEPIVTEQQTTLQVVSNTEREKWQSDTCVSLWLQRHEFGPYPALDAKTAHDRPSCYWVHLHLVIWAVESEVAGHIDNNHIVPSSPVG